MMETFRYDPLSLQGRSFRLLRLLGGVGPQIDGEIFEAWLQGEDLIPFEALSYAWGNLATPYEVRIGGKPLAITENLNIALQNLRLRDQDRILWVDAICIDQTNEKERGHQVSQMGDIYSQAEQVIFWLGDATPSVDFVMTALKQLERRSQKEAYFNWSLSNKRWQKLWFETRPDWNERSQERLKAGLSELMQRPWFERVWILQEVARARRAVVTTGRWVLSSPIFAVAPLLIHFKPSPHCQAVLDIMPGPSRKGSWWSQGRDLYTMLLKFRHSKASDPRDKIYALLGILSSHDNDANNLQPDYSRTEGQVIGDVTFVLFRYRFNIYNTMGDFLKHLPGLVHHAFLRLARLGSTEDVLKLLQDQGDKVHISTPALAAAAENRHFGAEIMEIFCAQSDMFIDESVVAAALENKVCGAKILYHMIWPPDEWNLRLVLNLVVTAAALSIGCAAELLEHLRGQNDTFLSDLIDETIESLHARCVAVGDMDTSPYNIQIAQQQLMWTIKQRLCQYFESHDGDSHIEDLKLWLNGASIVWDRTVPTSYTKNKMFPMTVRVRFETRSGIHLNLI